MRITVFTSNQPRHLSLIRQIAQVADEVYVVQECQSLVPQQKSPILEKYFSEVIRAEKAVFGEPQFTPKNVSSLSLRMGDLSSLSLATLRDALHSDLYVVFGASYIKGTLCDVLVEQGAYNIHMGISPFYRGSATNFWALYDGRPELVGATIHFLTQGLDSGPILFHALPKAECLSPFLLGMKAVRAAHDAFVSRLVLEKASQWKPVTQDKKLEIRYSRSIDFSDKVAEEYLMRDVRPDWIGQKLQDRSLQNLIEPYIPAQ